MTLYFGDGTNIATATGLGANLVNSAQTIKTDGAGFSVSQGGTSSYDAISLDYAASSSSNKLLIMVSMTVGLDFGGRIGVNLFIGGSRVDALISDTSGNVSRRTTGEHAGSQYNASNLGFNYLKTSPSTSSTTYSVRMSQGDNSTRNVYINRPHGEQNSNYNMRGTSTITILELSA